jgi:DNA-binding response OmpR family regulator
MSLKDRKMYRSASFSFSVEPVERLAWHNGTTLSLTPKVFGTLLCSLRNPGRVLTEDELFKEIWPDTFVEEVNVR